MGCAESDAADSGFVEGKQQLPNDSSRSSVPTVEAPRYIMVSDYEYDYTDTSGAQIGS
jgi:hypothetical protein